MSGEVKKNSLEDLAGLVNYEMQWEDLDGGVMILP